jgi:hypothetical protein
LIESVTRSFTGDVHLEDQPVAVSVGFSEGTLHLRLGGDTVGAWPAAQVEFLPLSDGGYELRADGDSIPFRPHQPTAFAAFLRDKFGDGTETDPTSPSPEPQAELPADPGPAAVSGDGAPEPASSWSEPFETPAATEVEPAEPATPDPVSPESTPFNAWTTEPTADTALTPSFLADEAEPIQDVSDLAFWGDMSPDALGLGETEEPEPLITWEPQTDESYAAGLGGGPTEGFTLPLAPGRNAPAVESPDPDHEVDTPRWHQPETPSFDHAAGAGDVDIEEPEQHQPEPAVFDDVHVGAEVDADTRRWPPTDPETPPSPAHPSWSPLSDTSMADPVIPETPAELTGARYDETTFQENDAPPAAPTSPVDLPEDGPAPLPPEPETVKDYLLDDIAFTSETSRAEDPIDAEASEPSGRKFNLGQFRARLGERKAPEESGGEAAGAGFFKTDSADDAENLRQWVVVVAAGLAIVVLLVLIVLGLSAVFSSDEAPETPETTAATTAPGVTAPGVEVTTTTTRVSSGSSIVQPTDGFVDSWNALASAYALNLAIEAEGTPVSAQAGPFIHVTYDNGALTLDMSPQGNGNDRDLLIAMGMAVAFAEPELSPEERKEVLSVLGIDVTNPDLSEVGGEIARGPVSYRATVVDGIIRLRVTTAPA